MDKEMQKKIGLGGAAAMAISTFLPWWKVSFMGIGAGLSGIQDWRGIVTILMAVAVGLMIFRGIKLSIVPAAIAALVILTAYIAVSGLGMGVSFGIGLFIATAGVAAAIYGSLPLLKDGKDIGALFGGS